MAAQPEEMELFSEIKEAMSEDPSAGVTKIQELLDKQLNSPLNIAVTGEGGSGKSSFVNAFRGIKNRGEGAAKTGCVETTMEAKAYPHPSYPNVTLWDLPGIGTTKFPADKYLEHVGLDKFDFFIIISAGRFRENDAKLAKAIQKMEKKFYFVRSKIDNDMQNEERDSQGDFDENECLALIREDCIKGLCEQGLKAPKVFLISSFEVNRFDFHLLEKTLEEDVPKHKRLALLLAMPTINLEIIEKKRKVFQTIIKFLAGTSCVGAATPIPGVSAAADLALLVIVVNKFNIGFGLDEPSLKRLSATSRVPLKDLQAVIKSDLCRGPVSALLITRHLGRLGLMAAAAMLLEEGARFIPLFGIPIAMGLSYAGTYFALKAFLDLIADDAQRVFRKALGLQTSL